MTEPAAPPLPGHGPNASRTRRIGLFGGTFDPPHHAHLALAHAALAALSLNEVRWIPTGQPWQKARPITPAAHRVAMVEAAIRGTAGSPAFTLDRIEVDREGPSYTLDTLDELAAREALTALAARGAGPAAGAVAGPGATGSSPHGPTVEWVLLIGQDQYAGLHTWRGWRELLARVSLAVALRPGVKAAPAPEVQALPHRVVPLPMMDISASDIRARVAAGQDISQLVPAEVAGYIARHGLYCNPPIADGCDLRS